MSLKPEVLVCSIDFEEVAFEDVSFVVDASLEVDLVVVIDVM
jgi:hypothetical protein